MRLRMSRVIGMFHEGNPLAEEYLRISIISMVILVAIAAVLVVIHIRRRKASDDLAREIMENCEEKDRRAEKY